MFILTNSLKEQEFKFELIEDNNLTILILLKNLTV